MAKRSVYGKTVRQIRLDAGLNLLEVQAVVGLSVPVISSIERGASPPFTASQLREFLQLADSLDRFHELMELQSHRRPVGTAIVKDDVVEIAVGCCDKMRDATEQNRIIFVHGGGFCVVADGFGCVIDNLQFCPFCAHRLWR